MGFFRGKVIPQEKCVSSTATYWYVSQTAAQVNTDPVIVMQSRINLKTRPAQSKNSGGFAMID